MDGVKARRKKRSGRGMENRGGGRPQPSLGERLCHGKHVDRLRQKKGAWLRWEKEEGKGRVSS